MLAGLAVVLREFRGVLQDIVAVLGETRALVRDLAGRGAPEPTPEVKFDAEEHAQIAKDMSDLAKDIPPPKAERIRIVAVTPQWPTGKPEPIGQIGTVVTFNGEPGLVDLSGGSVLPGWVRWEVLPDESESKTAPETIRERIEWVYVTDVATEWLRKYPRAKLDIENPTPVALVYRNDSPSRVDGIHGAPGASVDGLTWRPVKPGEGPRVDIAAPSFGP